MTNLQPTITLPNSPAGKLLLLAVLPFAALTVGVLGMHQPLLAIALCMTVPLIYSLTSRPQAATLLVMFVLYTNAAVVAVHFHGVPYIIGTSFILLLVIPLYYYLVLRREQVIITPIFPLLFLFTGVQLVGAMSASKPDAAFLDLLDFSTQGVLLYFLVTNVVRSPQMLRQVVWILVMAGAFLGSLSLYQQVTQTYDRNYGGFAQMSDAVFETEAKAGLPASGQPRLAGPIGEQNRYAAIMLVLVPLAWFRYLKESDRRLRALALLATLLIATGVVLTFSRQAAVAFGVMVLVMIWMRAIKPAQLGVMAVGVLLLLAAFPQYTIRLAKLEGLMAIIPTGSGTDVIKADGAIRGRATEAMAGLMMFADHPVIGVGPGMFRHYFQEYGVYGPRQFTGSRASHNTYLEVAAEHGILGLACFLPILFMVLNALARSHRRAVLVGQERSDMSIEFLLALVIYLTTFLVASFSYVRYFWLIMALASAAAYAAKRFAPPVVPLVAGPGDERGNQIA